jgi:DUF4097 and DUF4098 domain-containing protein YvlB
MLLAWSVVSIPLYGADNNNAALTEEFHHTYPLAAGGRISLENINGSVHVSSWDRNEVKIDAIKRADDKQDLDEARIEVEADNNSVSIRTKYPEHQNYSEGRHLASVEYTLTVPKNVRLDKFNLINGSLDVHDISGQVNASCINGKLTATGLSGTIRLATVNGRAEAEISPSGNDPLEISSVNGPVELTLPSDAKARIEATTISGSIDNSFGLHVNRHRFVGRDLQGELGGGGTLIRLNNVNGRIEIHRANDGHTLGPVKDLTPHGESDI